MSLNTITPQTQPTEGLFPLVEIKLTGNVKFDKLIDAIYYRYQVPYQLVSADIEYQGKKSYGTVVVQLKGNAAGNRSVLTYFKANSIQNTLKGYV